MSIVFTPPLGDIRQLTVPSSQSISLRFTAQLSAQLYTQLKHDGGRVQLWSDLPSITHASDGDWHELDFQDETTADDLTGRDVVKMSLVASADSPHTTTEHTLFLQVSIPTPTLSQQVQHSFTYRLVYSSGEVKWLGRFGQNGSLVLNPSNDLNSSTSALYLSDGWKSTAGNAREYRAFGIEPIPIEIARFNSTDYRVWAFGNERLLSEPKDASILFLVPRQRDLFAVDSQTYVMIASSGTVLDVSFTGSITYSPLQSGTISLQTRASSEDPTTFLKRILENINIRVLACVGSHAILGSSKVRVPIQIAIIPMECRQPSFQISLGLDDLASTLPSDVTNFSIFSPLSLDIQFFTSPLLKNGTVSFVMDPTGSQFLLSPVHNLPPTKSSTPTGFWKMTILCPHRPSTRPPGDRDILPTPPPSPRRLTIIKPSVSFASIDTVISPVPSRISDVGFSSHERERYIFHNDPPALSRGMTRSNKEPPRESIYTIFKNLYATFSIFVSVFYRLFWGLVPEVDSDQEDAEDEADGECVVNPDDEEGSQEGTVVVDSDPVVPTESTTSIDSTHDTPRDDDNIMQISGCAIQPSSQPTFSAAMTSSSSPEFYAEVTGELEQITMAFTRVPSDEDVNTIRKETPNSITRAVELNGSIQHGTIRELTANRVGGGTPLTTFYLLDFRGVKGGSIKVSPAKLDGLYERSGVIGNELDD